MAGLHSYRSFRSLLPFWREIGFLSLQTRAGSKYNVVSLRLLAKYDCASQNPPSNYSKCCFIHTGAYVSKDIDSKQNLPAKLTQKHGDQEMPLSVQSSYNALMDAAKLKTHLVKREQFSLVLKEFMVREKYRKGHVNFIKMAIHRMDEFGLEKDVVTYNRILDMYPKGRFAPRRMLDAFWPRSTPQLELALDILTKMEDNGVRPDYNTYMLLIEIFGKTSLPVDKCYRIAYWFDKYENIDPYEIKGGLPSDPLELSRLALERIAGKNGSIREIKVSEPQHVHRPYIASFGTTEVVK